MCLCFHFKGNLYTVNVTMSFFTVSSQRVHVGLYRQWKGNNVLRYLPCRHFIFRKCTCMIVTYFIQMGYQTGHSDRGKVITDLQWDCSVACPYLCWNYPYVAKRQRTLAAERQLQYGDSLNVRSDDLVLPCWKKVFTAQYVSLIPMNWLTKPLYSAFVTTQNFSSN